MEARIFLLLVVLLSGCGEFLPAPIKKNTWCESSLKGLYDGLQTSMWQTLDWSKEGLFLSLQCLCR